MAIARDTLNISSVALVLLFISLLCYCMLGGRITIAGKGSVHFGVPVAIPQSRFGSSKSRVLAARTRPQRGYLGQIHSSRPAPVDDTSSPSSYWTTYAMFKRAVNEHSKPAPPGQQRTINNLFSSSPTEQHQHQSQNQRQQNVSSTSGLTSLGNNILRPSPASALNGPINTKPRLTNTLSGTKRTHSGLAKVLSGGASFDDAQVKENSPIKCTAPKMTSCEYFDEDDFDDDIDLDIEDPSTKATVSYPTLPNTKNTSLPKTTVPKTATNTIMPGMFYPTLPRQQVRDTSSSTARTRDSGYQSRDPTFESSAPLPWSSSPPEHLEAPPQVASIRKFAYNNGPVPARDRPASPPPPAAKRSKLPWANELQAEQNGPPPPQHSTTMAAPARRFGDATPARKNPYPWNTTASAIKEQKEKVREVNKKKMKVNDATADSVEKTNMKKKRNTVARVFLSEEQQHVLDLVTEHKKSVFFTGSAGTGKSVLLREIIATLRRKFLREPDRIAVTASTGLAACNIGGVTLHSFAGIGLGKEEVPELVKKIKRNPKAKHRWMRTKILVVDEISMVDGELFDKLEAVARQIRNNGRPFGGIQLVITGDFFQLPPVPDSGKIARFAFDAATWNTSIEHTIGLHHVFRQKDPVFAGMLNEMREGRLSEASIRAFKSLHRPIEFSDMIDSTELFPTRSEVERANSTKMSQLVGDVRLYEARDGGTITDKTMRDKLLSNCMAPESINLKKGAQVMLIKNIDESLVNGSLGKIIGFMTESEFDNYTENENQFAATQGGTFKDETKDRTALAKNRLMDNLLGSTTQRWPVVRFTLADSTTRDLLCQRETWKIELPDGEVQASRAQIPLILAWALSIHKAQGQTLERVKVDLGKVFEKGQAYVALSRATSMQGLQVLRFDARKVMAHDKVRAFYSNLSRVEEIEKTTGKGGKGAKVGQAKRENGIGADEYEKKFATGSKF